jgi:FixJ family two-component response regulator
MAQSVVYVVDDDPALRSSIARLLRSHDLAVTTYASATEFLDHLPPRQPGCLLLDFSMPGMNGLELQKELASRSHCLGIVFVTGTGDVPSTVAAMKGGALDLLTKPFEEEALMDAVRGALERSHALHARQDAVDRGWTAYQLLTARERQVCLLVAQGLLNKQIAGELGPTEKTIKLHRANVMRKLGVNSVADLVRTVERLRDSGLLQELPS